MHEISNDKIKEIIINLEQDYPVDEWKVNGIHVWPNIRNKIYIFLLNYKSGDNKVFVKDNIKIRAGVAENGIKIFRLLKAFYRVSMFYLKLKPKDLVFFGSHFHRTMHGSRYFNRFFDPFIEHYQLQNKVYTVEFEKVYTNYYHPKGVIPMHDILNEYKLIMKFKSIFKVQNTSSRLTRYNDFYSNFLSIFPEAFNLGLKEKEIIMWSHKISSTKGFFTRFFIRAKPSKIIMLSYNGFDDLTAALLAASELKIKTVDFQHGYQTNIHMVYSHWTKIPEGSYNTMPKEYWNWDQRSKENIDQWAKKTQVVTSKVAGQPYLSYWTKRDIEKGEKIFIFYSLQNFSLNELFPDYLVNFIRSTSQQWILRLHPRSPFTEQDLIQKLNSVGIKEGKIIIHDSISIPLPQSLLVSFLHITNYSGCLIEAKYMGVPTVLIHEAGKEIFRDYIDDELVFYLNPSSPNFLLNISNVMNSVKNQKNESSVLPLINPLYF